MNLKYVKINEGGKVSMKDGTKGSMYTEEEQKLGDKVCDTVNVDQELKRFYAECTTHILKEFAKTMILAYSRKDKKLAAAAMDLAGEMFKALAMHVYIKVTVKEKEAKK